MQHHVQGCEPNHAHDDSSNNEETGPWMVGMETSPCDNAHRLIVTAQKHGGYKSNM